ncbi:2-dehydropantoate 2-reductase N-terminal domain-containing protein [Nocardia gipuzkoensis]|uniref:2-dehydropantoate 2-reductase N-terminal domain-containing protein n=1 Tax=Nocardia gipuzkoensis TaxID=2749991 RepID=UPI00245854BB|nr:2-dehydropantoate 2-reductase N-terminal domain-containing protein [Nocardia gipuzkoensis]
MTSQHRITVLGAGYVGLTTGACLASLGHNVVCVDSDPSVVAALRSGHTHLAEPDLNALVRAGLAAGTLGFDTEPIPAISHAQIVILCLPTPDRPDGSADLTAIDTTIAYLRHELRPSTVIVIKSTVPVGTHHRITAALDPAHVAVVYKPHLQRQGHPV